MLSVQNLLSKTQDRNVLINCCPANYRKHRLFVHRTEPEQAGIVCVDILVRIMWLRKRAVPGGLLHVRETPASLTGLKAVCMLCNPRERHHTADRHASTWWLQACGVAGQSTVWACMHHPAVRQAMWLPGCAAAGAPRACMCVVRLCAPV